MNASLLLTASALVLLLCAPASALPVADDDQQHACRARLALPEGRPRIGLALGGGGARGVAHISVLRTLEELKVPVDCIAGTSMGALVGALYASGMSLDDIEKLVLTMPWDEMFNDSLARPEQTFRRKRDDDLVLSQPGIGIGPKGVRMAPGLLAGERILLTFQKLVEPVATIDNFDNLPIPYRAVTADINSGAAVVIDGGDLALAMRASMSIPGVFPPVDIGGKVLIDGGVASNLPVDAVRAMGADIVIAIDVGTPLSTIDANAGLLSVADQLIGLMTVGNTRKTLAELGERDILIQPPLGTRVATADFTKGQLALEIGLEGVEPVRDRLAVLGVSDGDYAQNLALRTGRESAPPVVEFVRLDNQSPYSDAYVLARLNVPTGQPFDSADLDRQLFALYGNRTLSLATYEIVKEDGKTGVVVHAKAKPQGPNYLELGLSMSGDLEGRFDFNVRLGILRSPFNDSGGELRGMLQLGDETQLLGEVYQPLGEAGRNYLFARSQYLDRKINQYDAFGNKLAEFGARQLGVQVAAGREFGNYGALSLGYQRAVGQTEVLIGDPGIPKSTFQIGEMALDFSIDRGDSLYLPRDGYLMRNRYVVSRRSLGADEDFEQYNFDGIYAYGFGAHSVQAGLRYHTTLSGVAPLQSTYRVGGFTRLVGYQPNELFGQHYGVLLGGYSYRMASLMNQPAVLGVMLEYGNVWQNRTDMGFGDSVLNGSVYVAIDSWIGPILLGLGAREGGNSNLFLEVGHRF